MGKEKREDDHANVIGEKKVVARKNDEKSTPPVGA